MGAWSGKCERPRANVDHARSLDQNRGSSQRYVPDCSLSVKSCPFPSADAFAKIRLIRKSVEASKHCRNPWTAMEPTGSRCRVASSRETRVGAIFGDKIVGIRRTHPGESVR